MPETQPAMGHPHVYAVAGAQINKMHPATAPAAVPETRRGSTNHFTVFYANSLGDNGAKLADTVLANCEQDFARLQQWFGGITPSGLPFQIHIQSGSNGASHASCSATELFCDAFTATDGALESSLVVAEADEVFMANQGVGWNCGASNGEGLSRVLAAEIYPDELTPPGTNSTFASANNWLNGGRPNWVATNEGTDQNFVSIGCSTLFINYLQHQLGFTLDQIIQHGAPTLAQTFTNLTGRTYPFEPFALRLEVNISASTHANLSNDNPFPLPLPTVPLRGVVHVENVGDVGLNSDEFAGTQGRNLRLEGFLLQLDPTVAGLSMQYMAHVQNIGDTQWVSEGQFVGTRGQSRRLEGFAIRLTGPSAGNYTVMYMAHLQDIGDTGFSRDGEFCGTRGQSRQVEGLLIHVQPR